MKKSEEIYLSRIHHVIDFINTHLNESLSIDRLSKLAHFSPFHFHRIFRAIVGEPIHVFIQRLRLERAVSQMQYGPKTNFTQVALQVGFASSSDFSRAFKLKYGFSPRQFTREKYLQESKNRQDLFPNAEYGFGKLPSGTNPDRFRVRIVDRPAQHIAYVRIIGSFEMEKFLAAFERLTAWGTKHGIDTENHLIGMSLDDPDITPMKKYRFDWCLVLPGKRPNDRSINFGIIPSNRYAVIHCRGDIQKEGRAWRYLFHSWLPRSGFQPTQDPAMEVYRKNPQIVDWKMFDMDCCLPIRKLAKR